MIDRVRRAGRELLRQLMPDRTEAEVKKLWSKRNPDIVRIYTNSSDAPNRKQFVSTVAAEARLFERPEFYEFGCNMGVNLALLHDMFGDRAVYRGCDVNPHCVSHAENYPWARVVCCDEREMIRRNLAETSNMFISKSSFGYLSPQSAEMLAAHVAGWAQTIVLCEGMSREKSVYDTETSYYSHPYVEMLQRHGFHIASIDQIAAPHDVTEGFIIVAHKA